MNILQRIFSDHYEEIKYTLHPRDCEIENMVKVFQETVKSPVRRERQGNIKTAVVCNEKVVVQIINKICNHGKTFAFHNNKGTDHGMVGKAFAPGFGVFRDGR